jgi:hypothetical protein
MVRTLLLFTFLTLLVTGSHSSLAQSTGNGNGTHLPPLAVQAPGMSAPPVKTNDQANQELLQNYRKQRQKELLRDADELHQLSGELKEYWIRTALPSCPSIC